MVNFSITTDTNYSSLGAVNDDTITVRSDATLTINTSTVDIGYINGQYPRSRTLIQNVSTTTPIFVYIGSASQNGFIRAEAKGSFVCRGDKISIGTGNGVAGQTFNLPQDAGANNCPVIMTLYIESGAELRSNTAVPDVALNVTSTAYTNASNHSVVGRVFKQDTTANTVTFKNAVPNGVNVYMSNIVIARGATSAAVRTSYPTVDLQNGGFLDMEHAYFTEFVPDLNDANGVSMDHVGMLTNAQWAVTKGASQYRIRTGGVSSRNHATNAKAVYGTPGSVVFENFWFDSKGTSQNCVDWTDLVDSKFERCITTNYENSAAATNRTSYSGGNGWTNVKFYDCVSGFGSPYVFQFRGRNVEIDGHLDVGGCRTEYGGTTVNGGAFVLYNPCSNIRITNCSNVDPTTVNSATIGSSTLLSAAGRYIYVDGIEWWTSTTYGNGMGAIVSSTAQYGVFQNITVHGQIDARVIQTNDGADYNINKNIYLTDTQTNNSGSYQPNYNCTLTHCSYGDTAAVAGHSGPQGTGAGSRSILQYNNGDTDRTSAALHLLLADCPLIDDYREDILIQGAAPAFTGNNSIYMYTIGDTIDLTTDVHEGVTACTGLILAGGGGLMTVTVAVRRPGAAWSSFAAWDTTAISSAISALPGHPTDSVQFKFKIVATTTSTSHYINRLGLELTLSGAAATSSDPFTVEGQSPWESQTSVYGSGGSFGEMVQQIYLNTLNTTATRAT